MDLTRIHTPSAQGLFETVSVALAFILIPVLVWLISAAIEQKNKVIVNLNENRFECASLFRRFIATVVDVLVFVFFLRTSRVFLNAFEENIPTMHLYLLAHMGVGFLALIEMLVYQTIFEGKWGITLGKWIARIRVISYEGNNCGLQSALIRNIARVLDSFFGYLVGVIFFCFFQEAPTAG